MDTHICTLSFMLSLWNIQTICLVSLTFQITINATLKSEHYDKLLVFFYRWSVSDWSHCSVTCGAGRKIRTVLCVQVVSQTEKTILPDSDCVLPKPNSHRRCRRTDCPPAWVAADWGKVSCILKCN